MTTATESDSVEPAGPRWLLPYVWRHRGKLVATIITCMIWISAVAAEPLALRVIIDDSILARTAPLLPWILGLAGLGVVRFVTSIIWRYQGGRISLSVACDLRCDLYDHVQRLDMAAHAHLQSGQLVSRANSDVMLIQQLVGWTPILVGNLLAVILALTIMAVLSGVLAALVVGVLLIVFAVTRRMGKTVHAASWDAQQREAEMLTVVDEAVTGVRVVKAFGQENAELDQFVRRLTAMFGSRVRTVRMRAPFVAHLQAAPLLGQVGVLLLGGWLALHGHLSVGTFLAFASYLAYLTGATRSLAAILTMAPMARSGADRIAELLRLRSAVCEAPDAVEPARSGGGVRFKDVTFAYPDSDRPVLRDVSISVLPGETVAIVGPSGAGKTTALHLMLRMRDVTAGSVRIEGTDVRNWRLDALRSRTGVVFENSFLFSDTIGANIAYAKPDASMEEIRAAARAAAIDSFVESLPDRYDTQVGEGGLAVSGGQRQRIALARALLADPDVLILDDATSAVDVRVEKEIHDNLMRLCGDRTAIIVAYRESTVRMADRVVVLDGGCVVAEGTHDQLLNSSPIYQRLFGDVGDRDNGKSEPLEPVERVTPAAWQLAQSHPAVTIGDPPTPELLGAVQSLPPIVDKPEIDAEQEAAASEGFRLWAFLRPHWRALAVGMMLVLIDAVAALVGPLLVRVGIDAALVSRSSMVLVGVCAVYLGVTLVDWWDLWFNILWTSRTTERLLFALRIRIFAHLQKLGVDFYDRTQAGQIMTRITSDVDTISQLFQVGLIYALVAGVTAVGMAVVLFVLNVGLALVVFCVVPPAVAATVCYRRTAGPAYERAREKISALNSQLQETIAGVHVAQAFVREDTNLACYRKTADEQRHDSDTALRTTAIYISVIELLYVSALAATLYAGSSLVRDHSLAIGGLVAFLLYLAQVFAPIQQLSAVFDVYQRAKVGLVRIKQLLSEPTGSPQSQQQEQQRLRGEINMCDVSLQYPGVRAPALKQVRLQIPAGQRVAFVGQTGAGKSTIAKLITRFYDPTGGQILVDGLPTQCFHLTSFRRQLGYVPQEPFLFSRTIRDNIAYGRPDATDAMVEAAARAVGAHEFIADLDGGYVHPVQERGRSLSAGQSQLLCLARALLVDPSILILDEATSNLDLASESQVNRAMRVVSAGRTTIVIAHRPQSLQWVDRVVTVHGGTIVGEDRVTTRDGATTSQASSTCSTVAAPTHNKDLAPPGRIWEHQIDLPCWS